VSDIEWEKAGDNLLEAKVEYEGRHVLISRTPDEWQTNSIEFLEVVDFVGSSLEGAAGADIQMRRTVPTYEVDGAALRLAQLAIDVFEDAEAAADRINKVDD